MKTNKRRKVEKSKQKRQTSLPTPIDVNKTLQFSGGPTFPDTDDVTPIVEFLQNYRDAVDPRAQYPSKLISIKIPEPLLAAFRFKAEHAGVPYQTMMKRLMLKWLREV